MLFYFFSTPERLESQTFVLLINAVKFKYMGYFQTLFPDKSFKEVNVTAE